MTSRNDVEKFVEKFIFEYEKWNYEIVKPILIDAKDRSTESEISDDDRCRTTIVTDEYADF